MKIVKHVLATLILIGAFMQSAGALEYRTYPEVQAVLLQLSQSNPGIARYFSTIGSTIEGRDIPAIKITKNPQTDDPNKPDILFVGGQHAREWIGIEVTLRLAEYLVFNYADPAVQSLVDSREIWIVPIANPDGYVFSHTDTADAVRKWRKNRRDNGLYFGVDLNRNYATVLWTQYSGDNYADDNYRGSAPFQSRKHRR